MNRRLRIVLTKTGDLIDWLALSSEDIKIKAPKAPKVKKEKEPTGVDPKMLAVVVKLQSAWRMIKAVRRMREEMKGVICRFFKRENEN